jgi:raffinose/stachyose/melibiose transport system permease protein
VLILFAIIYLGPLLMLVNTSLKTLPEFMKNATAAHQLLTSRTSPTHGPRPTSRAT